MMYSHESECEICVVNAQGNSNIDDFVFYLAV